MLSWLRRQINFKDLFPTRWSFIIFISYMGLFINQGKINIEKNQLFRFSFQ
jgi:hypothetical protein